MTRAASEFVTRYVYEIHVSSRLWAMHIIHKVVDHSMSDMLNVVGSRYSETAATFGQGISTLDRNLGI